MLSKAELMALADKHGKKSDAAYRNYQETGITRYDRERRINEDMADAFRMAALASDEHAAHVNLRGEISFRAVQFREAIAADDIDRLRSAARSLVAYAEMIGLIGKEFRNEGNL